MSPFFRPLNVSESCDSEKVRKATKSKRNKAMIIIKDKTICRQSRELLRDIGEQGESSRSEWESMYSKQRTSLGRMLKYAYVS